MNVTLMNTHDLVGGAERCSYDIATQLNLRGDNASLIVGRKYGSDAFVHQLNYRFLDYQTRNVLFRTIGLTDVTLVSPLINCFRHPALKQADVYNLHNMHGFYWNLWTLPILARRSPVVLTLHDEWLLTGDCAYTYDCSRWERSCGNCPQVKLDGHVNKYALGGRDNTRMNLWLKRLITGMVAGNRLKIVTPSLWLAERTRQTPHLARFDVRCIPYGVDLDRFRPQDRESCRRHLGLPSDVPLILAIASNIDDRRKNFVLIRKLLREGGLPPGCRLVLAGKISDVEREEYRDYPVHVLGYLPEKQDIVCAFSACDFSLLLSKADNLPYVGIESLACGCPVLATDAGGIPELISPGVTGWLLPATCSAADLGAAMHAALASRECMQDMGRNARRVAEEKYAMEKFISAYSSLFSELASQ